MNICILLAGGIGSRAKQNIPKQYVDVLGSPMITYPMISFDKHPDVHAMVIVCNPMWHDLLNAVIQDHHIKNPVHFAEPGSSRHHSILSGLTKAHQLYDQIDLVLIHDAVRPIIMKPVLDQVISAANETGSALPVLPINDTVYVSENQRDVTGTSPRSELFHGQTPIALAFDRYFGLMQKVSDTLVPTLDGTCGIFFAYGQSVTKVQGHQYTFKVTTPEDFLKLEFLLGRLNASDNQTTASHDQDST